MRGSKKQQDSVQGSACTKQASRFGLARTLALLALALAVFPAAALQVALEVYPNNPVPGQVVNLRFTATNDTASTANDLRIEFVIPTALENTSDVLLSDGGDCTLISGASTCDAGETAFWDLGSLAAGTGRTVNMYTTIDSGLSGGETINMDVDLLAGGMVEATSNNVIDVLAEEFLTLSVDANAEPVAPGSALTYELTFGNRSASSASNAELRFPLPAGTTFVSADGGGTLQTTDVVWNLGIIGDGAGGSRRVTVQLAGSVQAGDILRVDAAELSGSVALATRTRVQTATTRVESLTDFALALDTDYSSVGGGDQTPLRLTVTNRSGSALSGVQVELFYPVGLASGSEVLLTDGGNCTDFGTATICNSGERAVWTIGDLGVGEGKTVALTPFTPSAITNGDLVSLVARGSAAGTTERWVRRALRNDSGRALDLRVDASQEPVAPGENLTYELNFGNRGSSASSNTELTFPLPAGTTFVSADGGGTLSGSEVVWDLDIVGAGEGGTRRVTVLLGGGIAAGDILEVNAAQITGDANFVTQVTRQYASTRVEDLADLALSVDSDISLLSADTFTPVRLTVTNRSGSPLTNVAVELFYPDGLPSAGDVLLTDGGDCTDFGTPTSCNSGEIAGWAIGTLAPGSGKTVAITPRSAATIPDGELISLVARASADSTTERWERRSLRNDSNRVLNLNVDARNEPVAPGDTLTYELTFGNQSGSSATSTELRFPLPAGTTLVDADGGGAQVGNEVVWDLGLLGTGEGGSRRVTVQLGGTIQAGDVLEVDAAQISADANFVTEISRQFASTRVEDLPDLALALDTDVSPLTVDSQTPIRLTVSNRGGTLLTGVEIELFYPFGLASANDVLLTDGGDCTEFSGTTSCRDGERAIWPIGDLGPGTGKTVVIVPSTAGTVTDGGLVPVVARASADTTTERWQARSLLNNASRLLNLAVDPAQEPVAPGDTLTYSLTFGNSGSFTATGSELRFPLPAGTTFVSATGGGTLSGSDVVWDLADLAPGQGGSREVTVQLEAGVLAGDILELDAATISADANLISQLSRQSASTRVESLPELSFALDGDMSPLLADTITPLHLVVSNTGSTVLTGVAIELFYPEGLASANDVVLSDNGDCTNVSASTDCRSGERAQWPIGNLAPGSGRTVTIAPETAAVLLDGDLITLLARTFSDTTTDRWEQLTLRNNDERALTLSVDAEQEPIAPGGTIDFAVSFGNAGDTSLQNGQIRFPLPAGTSLVTATEGGTVTDGILVWDLGLLTPGEVGVRSALLQFDAPLTGGELIESSAVEISADGVPPTRANRVTRAKTSNALDLTLPINPVLATQGDMLDVDPTVSNSAGIQATDVALQLFYAPFLSDLPDGQISGGGDCTTLSGTTVCDSGETVFWPSSLLDSGFSRVESIAPTIRLGANEPPDGTLINFFSRVRSSSLDGGFVTRTVRVGNAEVIGEPEMEVLGNGQTIADDDVVTSTTNGTDFGGLAINASPRDQIFEIENIGNAALQLIGDPLVELLNSDGSFSVFQQPVSAVAPAETVSFVVRFDPSTVGIKTATVSIDNSDFDENPYTFAIEGLAEGLLFPEIAVFGKGLEIPFGDISPRTADGTDFGEAAVDGDPVDQVFVIENLGSVDLDLTDMPPVSIGGGSTAAFLVVNQPTTPIPGGGSSSFTIRFDPEVLGIQTANVIFGNNDQDESPFTFGIQGSSVTEVSDVLFADGFEN